MPVRQLAQGHWLEHQVSSCEVPSTQYISPELAGQIDRSWQIALATPDRVLFDGPMLRLESFAAAPTAFSFTWSPTSYKLFHVLHQSHPELLVRHPQAAANPIGVSALIHSADHKLLLGRRSSRVAYHPNRIHPIAGCLEPKDGGNLFCAARREAQEEVGLTPADIASAMLLGLVEDPALGQPEAVLLLESSLTSAEILTRLDNAEHDSLLVLAADLPTLQSAVITNPLLTPVAIGALQLLLGELSRNT